jgi:hypothetical protein
MNEFPWRVLTQTQKFCRRQARCRTAQAELFRLYNTGTAR